MSFKSLAPPGCAMSVLQAATTTKRQTETHRERETHTERERQQRKADGQAKKTDRRREDDGVRSSLENFEKCREWRWMCG